MHLAPFQYLIRNVTVEIDFRVLLYANRLRLSLRPVQRVPLVRNDGVPFPSAYRETVI